MQRAFNEAKEKWGMTALPIMCFIRDKTEEEAIAVLREAVVHHREFFNTVGLDSMEKGTPTRSPLLTIVRKPTFKICQSL